MSMDSFKNSTALLIGSLTQPEIQFPLPYFGTIYLHYNNSKNISSSISGIELQTLMCKMICLVNVLLILLLVFGWAQNEKKQTNSTKMLDLIPSNTIIKKEEIGIKKSNSDLNLLLLIANIGLREVHPVFGLCVQVYYRY